MTLEQSSESTTNFLGPSLHLCCVQDVLCVVNKCIESRHTGASSALIKKCSRMRQIKCVCACVWGGGVVAGTLNVSIPADILLSTDSMQLHFYSADLDKKLAVLLFQPSKMLRPLADLPPCTTFQMLELPLTHHGTLCCDWHDSWVKGSKGSLKSHTLPPLTVQLLCVCVCDVSFF